MEHPARRISSRRWPVSVVVTALTAVVCVLTLTFIGQPEPGLDAPQHGRRPSARAGSGGEGRHHKGNRSM